MGKRYNRLKVILAEKEKTNRWLANEMKLGELTVSRWVTNSRQPSVETLFEISKLLNVNVCDLLVNNEGMTEEVTDDKA